MGSLLEKFKGFMALLSFLTIIPTGVHDLESASRIFYLTPIIGLLEGSIAAAPILLDAPIYVKAALILVASYLITGFSHLDGFADFADALGSGRSGKDALRIMKEPGRGAVATAATTLLIIVAYSSLLALLARGWWHVIMFSHVLASESMYLIAMVSTPPSYHGLSRDFIIESKRGARIAINLFAVGVIFLAIAYIRRDTVCHQLTMIASTIIAVIYTQMKSHRVLGFANGDVLGFCYELAKAAALISSAALISLRIGP